MKVWALLDEDGIPTKVAYTGMELKSPWVQLPANCGPYLATPKSHRFLKNGSIIERKKVRPVISASRVILGEYIYYEIKDLKVGERARVRVGELFVWVDGGTVMPIEATSVGSYTVELVDPDYRCRPHYKTFRVEVIDA